MEFILGIIFLLIIDIVLSVDNAILIASTTKDLEGKEKKWAQIIGAMGAVCLRLLFVMILMFAFHEAESIILIYMIGGSILIYIGITITIEKKHDKEKEKSTSVLWKAVLLIMAGDIMMSFDNALIISEVALEIGNSVWETITIVAIALALSLIIIIFFSAQLAKFMHENKWVVYVAAWLLVGIGIEMILKDALFNITIAHAWIMLISYSLGGIIVGSKYLIFDRNKEVEEIEKEKDAN